MERKDQKRGRVLLALLLASTGGAVACGPAATSKPSEETTDRGALTTHHTTAVDGAIVLRDATGAAIPQGSTTPYSPEKTCGACHDVGMITRGYHFQQGRTNAVNAIQVSDSFNPAKPWLLSDGMYGKT